MESPAPFINAVLLFLVEMMLSINIHTYVCQRDTHCSSCSEMTGQGCLRCVLQHNIQKTHLFSQFSKDNIHKTHIQTCNTTFVKTAIE